VAFVNVYEDPARAEAYSKLEFANTYYLAYRDLPEIAAKYALGCAALDFGCGTGRSSRFLTRLGFEVTGIDISEEMLRKARHPDPGGDYRLVVDGDLGPVAPGYDLVLSCGAQAASVQAARRSAEAGRRAGEPRLVTGDLLARVGIVLDPGLRRGQP